MTSTQCTLYFSLAIYHQPPQRRRRLTNNRSIQHPGSLTACCPELLHADNTQHHREPRRTARLRGLPCQGRRRLRTRPFWRTNRPSGFGSGAAQCAQCVVQRGQTQCVVVEEAPIEDLKVCRALPLDTTRHYSFE